MLVARSLLSARGERSLSERRLEEPLADINDGVGRRLQLKFEIPWLRVRVLADGIHDPAGALAAQRAVAINAWLVRSVCEDNRAVSSRDRTSATTP